MEHVEEDILGKFDQILFEFHDLILSDSKRKRAQITDALERLNRTHQLVHLHGNNTGGVLYLGEACFPDVLEATYVNRAVYSIREDAQPELPISCDAPNNPHNEEICLGRWNEMKIP